MQVITTQFLPEAVAYQEATLEAAAAFVIQMEKSLLSSGPSVVKATRMLEEVDVEYKGTFYEEAIYGVLQAQFGTTGAGRGACFY